MVRTISARPCQNRYLDSLSGFKEIVWQVLKKITIYAWRPVEQWVNHLAWERARPIQALQLLQAFTAKAVHSVIGAATTRLFHGPVQLVLEVRDRWLGREEDGLADGADKKPVITTAVRSEVHGNRSCTSRNAVYDDVVWVAAKLDEHGG